MTTSIAVIGTGNGAIAYAADLALAGHEVRLCAVPGRRDRLAAIRASGTIEVLDEAFDLPGTSGAAGGLTGTARLAGVGDDLAGAVDVSELIVVCVTVAGQRTVARHLLPLLRERHKVVFTPGKYGSLEFAELVRRSGGVAEVSVAETESLLYVTRRVGDDGVWIGSVKHDMTCAGPPGDNAARDLFCALFPTVRPGRNVLEVGFCGHGDVMHPVHAMLNSASVENDPQRTYRYLGVTPGIARVITALDAERLAVAEAGGIAALPVPEALGRFYGSSTSDVYAAITSTAAYEHLRPADTTMHRYIDEKVPFGLVPLVSLADLFGVDCPLARAMTNLSGAVNDKDYWSLGRTVDRMGLDQRSLTTILRS